MATAKLLIGDADPNVLIEQMTEHDLLAVVEIEEESGLSPWGWDAYHKELQSPEEVIMLVARTDSTSGAVAGFIVSRLIGAELHVYNVAVRPALRRRGVAARLLRAVLVWGRLKGAELAFLEVREGNGAAQNLYRGCGFAVAGRRRQYYAAPVEDALLMSVSLRSKP
ncbi:MAG: ribosomal-protein-alanine N-acetyltransferase [Acidobacteria bacterium]|nr:MAG: ribosomal-protein-alanine N-acetyltransferase [Acidobacteriota bacterium]